MAARVSNSCGSGEALCMHGRVARGLAGRRALRRTRPRAPSAEGQSGLPQRSLQQVVQDANEVYAAKKRPWCQPWTILLSGSTIIGLSWKLFGHGLWSLLAVGVTGAITLWWYLFLVALPVLERQQPSLQYGEAPDSALGGPPQVGDERQW